MQVNHIYLRKEIDL